MYNLYYDDIIMCVHYKMYTCCSIYMIFTRVKVYSCRARGRKRFCETRVEIVSYNLGTDVYTNMLHIVYLISYTYTTMYNTLRPDVAPNEYYYALLIIRIRIYSESYIMFYHIHALLRTPPM